MLGHRDALAVTGLAQARRLQNASAPHWKTAEFSSTFLLHQSSDTYCSPLPLSRCYIPKSLGALTVLNSYPFSGVAARRHRRTRVVPDRTGSHGRRGYIGRNTTAREREATTPRAKKTTVA